jgi:hypothetical protein
VYLAVTRCNFVDAVHLCVQEPNLLPACPSSSSQQPNSAVERSPKNAIRRKSSMSASTGRSRTPCSAQASRRWSGLPRSLQETFHFTSGLFFHRFCMEVIPFHVVCKSGRAGTVRIIDQGVTCWLTCRRLDSITTRHTFIQVVPTYLTRRACVIIWPIVS